MVKVTKVIEMEESEIKNLGKACSGCSFLTNTNPDHPEDGGPEHTCELGMFSYQFEHAEDCIRPAVCIKKFG